MTTNNIPHAPDATAIAQSAAELQLRKRGYSHQEYFRDLAHGEVWVQNISAKFLSFEIEGLPGQSARHCQIPPLPDPVCLTDELDYEAIKRSNEFKKMLAKREYSKNKAPRAELSLIDAVQVEAYYRKKAVGLQLYRPDGQPDVEAAREIANRARREYLSRDGAKEFDLATHQGFTPPKSAMELVQIDLAARNMVIDPNTGLASNRAQGGGMIGNGGVRDTELVSPRVIGLLAEVDPRLQPHERMDEHTFNAHLEAMSSGLGVDDFALIQAQGYYRSTKVWAGKMLGHLHSEMGDEDPNADLTLTGRAAVARFSGPTGAAPRQQPAAVAAQYQGPSGFVNAPFRQASVQDSSELVGPDGAPF